jgi:manganese/zinc/iron transport system substrate-binding protein
MQHNLSNSYSARRTLAPWRLLSSLALLALLVAILAGCGGEAEAADADSGQLQIVTTTGQIADAARAVGGEHVAVSALMGPGTDPHLYVASEGDVDRLVRADIIFYNGLFLEAQMTDVLRQIGERKPAVPVAEHIPTDRLLPWATYADEYDPHVWFDVSLWMYAVQAVADTLAEQDPAHAADYAANAKAYLQELSELDAYVKQQAATLPAEERILVTAHDAFHYFGRAYGFDVRGLQGISTASEAGAADVRDLADFIAAQQIPAIFVETSVPVRNVEALQAAVHDRGADVEIGGQLYSDALGAPDSDGGTYIGMVKHNIDTIVGALSK